MKRCPYCGAEYPNAVVLCVIDHELLVDKCVTKPGFFCRLSNCYSHTSDTERRWLFWTLAGLVAPFAFALILSRYVPKAKTPCIVVLTTCFSNGEERLTFRPEPPGAVVTYADLVAASYNGNVQPRAVRSFGAVFPLRNGTDPNYLLHFVALPKRGASFRGKPLAYTPGSYTVAYTASQTALRVRLGVAFERKGIEDYIARLRNCWEQKQLGPLRRKSYRDPFFVTTDPITNAAPGIR